MISAKRRERLKKNRGNILACQLKDMPENKRQDIILTMYEECQYEFDDGVNCAVGACMTKQELKQTISEGHNNDSVVTIAGIMHLIESEQDTLLTLQKLHDACIISRADDRQFWNFENALNQVIETGEIVNCDSLENPFSFSNQYFELVNDSWVSKASSVSGVDYVPAK